LTGHIVRQVPAADEQLPSPALSAQMGGDIATDPRDPKDPKALQRVFQFDVALSGPVDLDRFGQRVFVRFDEEMLPLGLQWYRSLRLLFLSTFDV
jgi:putative peptide zinc metalloprotease protein